MGKINFLIKTGFKPFIYFYTEWRELNNFLSACSRYERHFQFDI